MKIFPIAQLDFALIYVFFYRSKIKDRNIFSTWRITSRYFKSENSIAFHLFFKHVEIVYDHSNEEIESEEWTADDEYDKVKVGIEIRLSLRLQIHSSRVHRILHHLHPTLEGRHLKQGQVSNANVVESDLTILPRVVLAETLFLRVHYLKSKRSCRQ